MNNITINTQSRNELNASIILAAISWSLTTIFADEIIAANGREIFNLFPLLPITIFSSAIFRHFKRTGRASANEVVQNMFSAAVITGIFSLIYSNAEGAGFAQLSMMTAYTCFAGSLAVISLMRNCIAIQLHNRQP
jgi:O-antigen/teichoic acid export membrane protein